MVLLLDRGQGAGAHKDVVIWYDLEIGVWPYCICKGMTYTCEGAEWARRQAGKTINRRKHWREMP